MFSVGKFTLSPGLASILITPVAECYLYNVQQKRTDFIKWLEVQRTGVVLKIADEVLEFGAVRRKFKFSGVQGRVWDQTAPFL